MSIQAETSRHICGCHSGLYNLYIYGMDFVKHRNAWWYQWNMCDFHACYPVRKYISIPCLPTIPAELGLPP